MAYPECDRKTCINWENGYCMIKDPEKTESACIDYEDALDFLRLRVDVIKGSLG